MITNSTIETLLTRRSVRSYKPEQVDAEALETVLHAGTYAPTGRGLQLPLIVAVQDKDDLEALRRLNAGILGSDMDPYYGAPTIIFVFNTVNGNTYVEDGSSVLTYMTVAAKAIGLDTVWVNRERQMFETEEGKVFKSKWGIPEEYVGIGALSIGYAAGENPEPAPRKEGYVIRG